MLQSISQLIYISQGDPLFLKYVFRIFNLSYCQWQALLNQVYRCDYKLVHFNIILSLAFFFHLKNVQVIYYFISGSSLRNTSILSEIEFPVLPSHIDLQTSNCMKVKFCYQLQSLYSYARRFMYSVLIFILFVLSFLNMDLLQDPSKNDTCRRLVSL